MNKTINKEDLIEKDVTSTSGTMTKEETKVETIVEQDPLKIELEKVQKKSSKTEVEKAKDNLFFNAKRARELGIDPADVLGIKIDGKEDEDEDEDEKPLTVGMFKKIQQAGATKTALQLAEEIVDTSERELTKFYLENRIQPSGNPQEDLKDARRMVNAVRNEKIVEEVTRKTTAKSHSNASGVDAKKSEIEGELTPQEMLFMKKPFNMTKEQIIKARK